MCTYGPPLQLDEVALAFCDDHRSSREYHTTYTTLYIYIKPVLNFIHIFFGPFCGLVVRVPGYTSRGPVSIPGATTFSEK
jgi:hypothetical protein